jgi:hypothetical protein
VAQFLADAQGAIAAARLAGDEGFQVTGFVEQPFLGQAVEGGLDKFRRRAALAQLADEFSATVLASRQEVHGGPPHGDGRIEHGRHRRDQ